MLEWLVVIAAGFAGGLLNAVAGGGSMITLPALLFAGLPPLMANATGTAALLPGYIASAWRLRRDIVWPAQLSPSALVAIALSGGGSGALLLLAGGERLFSTVIPLLLLLATALFALAPWLQAQTLRQAGEVLPALGRRRAGGGMLFAVCVYGGYFNGGLGIILLAVLALIGQQNLLGMNAVKNVLSALLTLVAIAIYSAGHLLDLHWLLVMAVAAIAGGYVGAVFAYRLSARVIRSVVIVSGVLMSVWFMVH